MPEPEVQIVSNEAGEATAVIVPIDLWRQISSEKETAHLLRSEAMKERLLAALRRTEGIQFDDAVAKLGL